MGSDLHAAIGRLVRTCECAIRQGDTPNPAALHTFQQQLVAARDAPSHTQTDDTLSTAIWYYRETIPEDTRTTALTDLTEQVAQLERSRELTTDAGHRLGADTANG